MTALNGSLNSGCGYYFVGGSENDQYFKLIRDERK